jgi:hypothetical protein
MSYSEGYSATASRCRAGSSSSEQRTSDIEKFSHEAQILPSTYEIENERQKTTGEEEKIVFLVAAGG